MSSIAVPLVGQLDLLALPWIPIAVTLIGLAGAWAYQYLIGGARNRYLAKIPLVGEEVGDAATQRVAFIQNAKKLVAEGYHKFRNSCFRVNAMNSDIVLLDPRFLAELRDTPDSIISQSAAVEESMQFRYTGLSNRPIVPHIVKKDLTPALRRLNPIIAEEVDQCFRELLPPSEFTTFNPVPINHILVQMVAIVSGRIFIGPELCRSPEYVDMAINYTMDVINAREAVTKIPKWQRIFKAPYLSEVKSLREREKKAWALMTPIIAARLRAVDDPDYQKPDDLLQWILDSDAKLSQQDMAEMQLALTFAAIHTTTMTVTSVFHTLAAMPGLVPELRAEIRSVLQEHGTFTSAALLDMKKMDSFFNENARYFPLAFTSFGRKVLQNLTLSSGKVIPAGVTIEVTSHPAAFDPEIVPNPERFDALRSYNLRQAAGDEKGGANQFVTASLSNLMWGYGRHACPGRYFAANEAKMIVARAILDYEFTNADGYEGRYPSMEFGLQSIPDPTKQLLFKRRET